ncbi:Nramp family divalent metal transporter [Haloplanus salilacus]|uniref:Nramp family divalent metal transporter n=1 Tax=Haloplanus salilacus TaxID=2949994 RepID=UPI0030D23A52
MGRDTKSLRDRLEAVGPALLLAAVVVGPGSIALSTITGGTYGYTLLWVPVAATLFMITYTWMAARIGLVTGKTFFGATRERYGDTVAKVGGVFGFLTILAFQAGNNAGIGFASAALFGVGDPVLWAIVFTVLAAAFLWLPSLYDKVETLVRVVVGIMLVSFVATLLIVGVDFSAAARGLVPSFPDQASVLLSLGLAATNFSIVAVVYQTNLMKENDWGPEKLADEGLDSLLGIAILGIIVMTILLTSAAAIFGTDAQAFSAQEMAVQLRPFAGPAAFYLFTIGFFFASLSSLVVNALIGGALLTDGFDKDPSMDSRPVKLTATGAMIIGTVAILLSQGAGSPTELLRAAQALAVVAFPLLGFLILTIARDRSMMGEYTNPWYVNVLGGLGYLVIIGIIVNYLQTVLAEFGINLLG